MQHKHLAPYLVCGGSLSIFLQLILPIVGTYVKTKHHHGGAKWTATIFGFVWDLA